MVEQTMSASHARPSRAPRAAAKSSGESTSRNFSPSPEHELDSETPALMPLPWRPLMLPLSSLRPPSRKSRIHSKAQIRQIADSILAFGCINPIVVDQHRRIRAGIARFEAAKQLGLKRIPVISVEHLSEAQLRAYALADNKLAEKAGWDRE